jgi:peptide/nickel transport system substrate-binding protein
MAYASDIAKHGITFGDIGAKIQADLAEIGITVNLVPQPVATNLDGYRGGTLQMSVQWWGPAFPDPSYYDAFNPGKLVGTRVGWAEGSSPAIEEIAARAALAIEPAARAAIYGEWQKALNETGPYIPLFQPPTTLVSTTAVENVSYNPSWTVDLTEVRPAAN